MRVCLLVEVCIQHECAQEAAPVPLPDNPTSCSPTHTCTYSSHPSTLQQTDTRSRMHTHTPFLWYFLCSKCICHRRLLRGGLLIILAGTKRMETMCLILVLFHSDHNHKHAPPIKLQLSCHQPSAVSSIISNNQQKLLNITSAVTNLNFGFNDFDSSGLGSLCTSDSIFGLIKMNLEGSGSRFLAWW